MKIINLFHTKKGQSLVEILIAIGLAAIILPALLTGLVASREGKAQEKQRLEATILLREAEETVRSVREKSWILFAQNGTFHPQISGSSWVLANGNEMINGYTRSITISDAKRNPSGQITETGGTLDLSTKKVMSTVSWTTPFASSVETTNYYQRYLQNNAFLETTDAQFNEGTFINTTVVGAGNNASVGLTSITSPGNWNNPQVVKTIDLPGTGDANDIFVSNNKAYIVTVSNSGPDFFIYDVSTPSDPTFLGSLDLGATGYAIVVSGNYAYAATSHDSRELTVINISNPSNPSLAGLHFNTPNTKSDGRGIAVSGTVAFLVTDNNTTNPGYELYSINISNPLAPTQLGGINLSSSTRDIFTLGNFAYIASTSNIEELQVIDISNPSAPSFAGSYDSPGRSDSQSVYVVDTTAYTSDTQLNILNISNPININSIGSYNAPGIPYAIYVSGNFTFLGHSQTNSQFNVIDISNPASPQLYGSANLGGIGYGIFVVGDYAYVATSNNNAEFQIIMGGTGSSSYAGSGIFESQNLDPLSNVAFNNIIWSANIPVSTTLNLQVAISDNVNGPWDFFGSDGGSGTFFNSPGPIPLSRINGRYMRYKAIFSSDGLSTPTLDEVSINYSP